jgi:hypothetical protein
MLIIEKLNNGEVLSESQHHRITKAIKAGNYQMSIQASEWHYCSPRATIDYEDYHKMELAIFNKSKRGWFNVSKSNVIKEFPRYKELIERADGLGSSATVFGYLDVEIINDLYVYLCSRKK